jgi:hypothetical protein
MRETITQYGEKTCCAFSVKALVNSTQNTAGDPYRGTGARAPGQQPSGSPEIPW